MEKLRIGLSASFSHPDPSRALFKGKRLTYAEEGMTHWLSVPGCLVYLVPSRPAHDYAGLAEDLDGLVLTGGADVAPNYYNESPLRPEWNGDPYRDHYEIALFSACHQAGVPIFGVCRGLQLINVALGGTLYQDIETQVSGSLNHRNWEIYDQNYHDVSLVEGSRLAQLFSGRPGGRVNSVHHQGIKTLAPRLRAEAHSVPDNIVEAIRYEGEGYVCAVQWHPEWLPGHEDDLVGARPLLEDFLTAARKRAANR